MLSKINIDIINSLTISSNKKNELSKIGDYNFTVYDEEITGRQFDVASRLPILFVLNVIITSYIDNKH